MTCEALAFDFDDPRIGEVRHRDPTSSVEAAQVVDANRQRDVLARELRSEIHGLTADELESRTGFKREHIASRLAQMRRWGDVYTSGKRINHHNIAVQIWFLSSTARPT